MSAVLSSKSGGSADAFLIVKTKKAGTIKGEVTEPAHQQQIAVAGFEFGVSSASAIGSGQATARRQYKHLVVTKALDSASTSLMSALAFNDEVKELKLGLRKAGGEDDFFTIALAGARVVALDIVYDPMGNASERVEFAFTKIDVSYRVQDGQGVLGATNVFADEIIAH